MNRVPGLLESLDQSLKLRPPLVAGPYPRFEGRGDFLDVLDVFTDRFLFLAYLGYCIYKWLSDGVYGSNNHGSLIYMACLYGVALAIYVISWAVRRRQGMDLSMVYNEIPAE